MNAYYNIEVTKTNKPKSGYKVRWSDLTVIQVTMYWRGLNIGKGFKARMRDNLTGKIIDRKA